MKETITISIWNLNLPTKEATAYINIYFWNTGCLIMGITKEQSVAFAKSLTFSKSIDAATLESLLLDKTTLGGNEPIAHVYWASDKSTLIPKNVYEAQTSLDWIRQIHHVDVEESIISSAVPKPACFSVNVINEPINNLFRNTFPDALIDNINPLFIPYVAPKSTTLNLSVLDNLIIYTFYHEQKLVHHHIEYGVNKDQIMLQINAQFEHINVTQDAISIQLQGYGNALPGLQAYLEMYFPVLTLTDSSFFNHLLSCE